MTAYTKKHNVGTNPKLVNRLKPEVARLAADLYGLITAYNASESTQAILLAALQAGTIPLPLNGFKECDANGDIIGIQGFQPTCVLNLTADITLTGITYSARLNSMVVTLQVLAAAANPTDTVLLTVTQVDNDVTITVTPNDGTNNSATPVGLTTAQLVLAINGNVTGTYDGINVTITDTGSVLTLFTASGGDATALADSGEGDGVAAEFTGGENYSGGELGPYSTPIHQSASPASDGDNSQRLVWAASNNDPIVIQVPLPEDIDTTADMTLKVVIASADTTDAVGFTVETWFDVGDTKVTDTTTTNQTATPAEKTATIAAADIPSTAKHMTMTLAPVAHTTDIMYLHGAKLSYTRDY